MMSGNKTFFTGHHLKRSVFNIDPHFLPAHLYKFLYAAGYARVVAGRAGKKRHADEQH